MYRKKMYDYIVIWWLTASKISIRFVKECIFLFWLNVSDLYWQNVAGEVRVRLTLVSPTTLYIYKNKGKCESIVCHKVGFTPETNHIFSFIKDDFNSCHVIFLSIPIISDSYTTITFSFIFCNIDFYFFIFLRGTFSHYCDTSCIQRLFVVATSKCI